MDKKDSKGGPSAIEEHIINPIKSNPRQLEVITINGIQQQKTWECVVIGKQPPAPKSEGGCCLVM